MKIRSCGSQRRETTICDVCWSARRSTSWVRSGRTPISGVGDSRLPPAAGKNAKKRAVVAVARKLAVLLHRLWVSAEVYEPLRNPADKPDSIAQAVPA